MTKKYLELQGSTDSLLNPTIRSKIIFGVAAIMKKLHKLNIVHSNLTIGNVLLDDNLEPMINNFGFAGISNGGPFAEVPPKLANPLSMEYIFSLPLEKIQSKDSLFESDVYSYGIFLYLMFSPQMLHPNRIRSYFQVYTYISTGQKYIYTKDPITSLIITGK